MRCQGSCHQGFCQAGLGCATLGSSACACYCWALMGHDPAALNCLVCRAGGHADGHLNGTYSNGQVRLQPTPAANACSQCLQPTPACALRCSVAAHAPTLTSAPPAPLPLPQHAQPKYLDEGGGSLAQYQGDKLHSLIRGSPGFACAVLVTQGVPLGMALGRAVVSDPDSAHAHALLPCLLSALPTGVACAGLGRALSSSHSHQLPLLLALGLAAMAGSALVCFLVGLPIGKVRGVGGRQQEPAQPAACHQHTGGEVAGCPHHNASTLHPICS